MSTVCLWLRGQELLAVAPLIAKDCLNRAVFNVIPCLHGGKLFRGSLSPAWNASGQAVLFVIVGFICCFYFFAYMTCPTSAYLSDFFQPVNE